MVGLHPAWQRACARYNVAAQADGRPPSSRQIDAWFWSETIAGQAVGRAAVDGAASENMTVGGRFFVLVPFLPSG
jgi:hypothetical protein